MSRAARSVPSTGTSAEVNRLAQMLEHRGTQSLRARSLVVEANARAEAIEAPGHVQLLLEVVAQGKVEERGAKGRQLHGGGEPALDDGEIDGGVMLEEIRHEGAHLDPGTPGRLHLGEARASDQDQPSLRNLGGDQGEGLRALAKQAPPHPRSPTEARITRSSARYPSFARSAARSRRARGSKWKV